MGFEIAGGQLPKAKYINNQMDARCYLQRDCKHSQNKYINHTRVQAHVQARKGLRKSILYGCVNFAKLQSHLITNVHLRAFHYILHLVAILFDSAIWMLANLFSRRHDKQGASHTTYTQTKNTWLQTMQMQSSDMTSSVYNDTIIQLTNKSYAEFIILCAMECCFAQSLWLCLQFSTWKCCLACNRKHSCIHPCTGECLFSPYRS